MKDLTRFLVLPVLFLQGIYTRIVTPKLPEATGPRSGVSGVGPELSLLVVGDSSAAGVGANTQAEALMGCLVRILEKRKRVSWELIAHTGARTRDLIETLNNRSLSAIDVAVLAVGVNDVTGRVAVRSWLEQHNQLMGILKNRFSASKILVSELPPMGKFPALPPLLRRHLGRRAREFDEARAQWAQKQVGVKVVPVSFDLGDETLIASDGFHPGPRGYEFWAEVMAQQILNDTKDQSCVG